MTVVSLRRSRGGRHRNLAAIFAAADVVAAADVLRHGASADDGRRSLREQAPVPNPASKRPYERPSLTDVNSADPEDDAELICRPKKSPAKRQRVTP